ncbi:hypothetical protein HanRHA438_Chr04g0174101 [Helianthus annuus]|nr:hypothetical protein HanRHA438_Chr04g0174101 [Helianthus annuus]
MKVLINYKFATLPFLTKYDIMRLISSGFSLRLELTKAIDNKCINNLPLGYCRSQSVVKLVAACLSLSLRLEQRCSRKTTALTNSPLDVDGIFSESLQILLLEQNPGGSVFSSGSPFRQAFVLLGSTPGFPNTSSFCVKLVFRLPLSLSCRDRSLAFRSNKFETCTSQPLYYKPIKL